MDHQGCDLPIPGLGIPVERGVEAIRQRRGQGLGAALVAADPLPQMVQVDHAFTPGLACAGTAP